MGHPDVCSHELHCGMCPTESMRPAVVGRSDRFGMCYVQDFFQAAHAKNDPNSGSKEIFEAYLRQQFRLDGEEGKKAQAYKYATSYLHGLDIKPADILDSFQTMGFKAVVLYRENKLEQYLSLQIASMSGVY